MKIRFLYNFLFINECKEILFPLGIKGLIQLDELVLVFIYGSTADEIEKMPARNIYAYNESGEQVWQIQEPLQHGEGYSSYADISVRKDGKIVAGSTRGEEYIVNIKDGSVAHIKNQRSW